LVVGGAVRRHPAFTQPGSRRYTQRGKRRDGLPGLATGTERGDKERLLAPRHPAFNKHPNPRKRRLQAQGVDCCSACGGTELVDAVDNHGQPYRGCARCVIGTAKGSEAKQ
jgi:hypothetical protein